MTGSNYTIVNLDDRSAVVYPYLEYSLSDNAVLTVIGYVTIGKQDAEFGAFGLGAIARRCSSTPAEYSPILRGRTCCCRLFRRVCLQM